MRVSESFATFLEVLSSSVLSFGAIGYGFEVDGYISPALSRIW